jgi:hypothetical protein
MKNNEKNTDSIDFYLRLVDYTKYLYEEEKERTLQLNSVMKIYLTILTFTLGAIIFKFYDFKELLNSMNINHSDKYQFFWILSYLSILMIFISFFTTISVVKIRRFERLCSPKNFVKEATKVKNEIKLLSLINANYVVATERNWVVNQKKAKFLTYSLLSYFIGMFLFVFASIILTF